MNSKRLGKVYEGRWKVIDIVHSDTTKKVLGYNLENIYNKEIIYICINHMQQIDKNKNSVSLIRGRRAYRERKKCDCWGHLKGN